MPLAQRPARATRPYARVGLNKPLEPRFFATALGPNGYTDTPAVTLNP